MPQNRPHTTTLSSRERRLVRVSGIVQGVGFRPFVYAAARSRGLAGTVRNTPAGVEIEVEGDPGRLDDFARALRHEAPAAASVDRCEESPLPLAGEEGFRIVESELDGRLAALISPDLATCPDCLRELRGPADRRHGYAFVNCTRCGPRFTVILELPYDRERTTMRVFPLCADCGRERADPEDRRFHAEPIACPACGPRLELVPSPRAAPNAPRGGGAAGALASPPADPLAAAAALLGAGGIVAVKGIGGFQLACDARNGRAVAELRRRKRRPAKPFAVMVRDLEAALELAEVGPAARAALAGPVAPIALVPARAGHGLDPGVAPDTDLLGLMLPASPLHHLLLERCGGPLVMTSGNARDEPIAIGNEEALERLGSIADAFLLHDRGIAARYDDSIVRVLDGGATVLRRARGFAPRPVELPRPAPEPILAVGGHLKGAFCLAAGDRAFLSQHLGDLDSPAALEGFEGILAQYERLFGIAAATVAHDMHPDYLSTRLAAARAPAARRIAVQHHHAHVAACLAEHGASGPAIGIAFDGAGYGPDGTVWGGEVLVADLAGYSRVAALSAVPMPGGEAAAREPWRMAAAQLRAAFGEGFLELELELCRRIDPERWAVLRRAIERGVGCPLTSSAGRLFDAVASLLGICDANAHEGHAAAKLEALARPAAGEAAEPYPLPLGAGDPPRLETAPLVRGVVEDIRAGVPAPVVAARFHAGLVAGTLEACLCARAATGIGLVALSGGAFQNQILADGLAGRLRERGFEVLTHRRVPPNDGGLAYGQAAVAAELLSRRR